MAWRPNRGRAPEQRRELWHRWREGQTLTEIGEALGEQPGSVFGTICASCGYPPRERTRPERHLTRSDWEEITRSLAAGDSLRAVASRLRRSPSTVGRQVSRNGRRERHRSEDSDDVAWRRARRPKACVPAERPRLWAEVAQKLSEDWSPQQISGWLQKKVTDDARMPVSP
jgi:DNA-binding CsgD family transcriptional regulator